MFANVLVGVDGRQGGRDAIALAKQLTEPDGRLTLVHVYHWFGTGHAPLVMPGEREDSTALLRSERDAAGVAAELLSFGEARPARGLHELAERRNADLIVVGSSCHGVIGRVMMGDDTHAALNGAPCAIAIAPRGYAATRRPLLKLGVGYDASTESEAALALARRLAARSGAEIHAVNVVSMQDRRVEKPIPDDWPTAAEALTERARKRVRELEGVEGEAVYGGAREELVRFGHSVDVLIVGSRSFGPVGRLFHGSVSSYLARHAPCPLVVLPRAALGAREVQPAVTGTHGATPD
jgi:nucleotide-binding universal stress UspA family protein